MSSTKSVPSRLVEPHAKKMSNKNPSSTSFPHEQTEYDPQTSSSARGEEPYNPPANRFGKLRNSTTANADHHHHQHTAANKVPLPREDVEHIVRYTEAETGEADWNKEEGAKNQKPNKKKAETTTVASTKRNTNLPTTSASGATQEVVNKNKTDANANKKNITNANKAHEYPLPVKSNAPYDKVVVSGYDEYGIDYHMSPPSPPPSTADEHPSLPRSHRRNSNITINDNNNNIAIASAAPVAQNNKTSKGNKSTRGNKKSGRAHWPRGLGQDEATLSRFTNESPSSSAWRRGNQQHQRPPRSGAAEGALPSHTWQDDGSTRREGQGKRVTHGSVPANRWEAHTNNNNNDIKNKNMNNMSNLEMVAKEGGRDVVSHDRSGHHGHDAMEMDLDHPLEEDVLEADEECAEELVGGEGGEERERHKTAREIHAPQAARGPQPVITTDDNPLFPPQRKEEPFSTAATAEQTAAIERFNVSASGSIPSPSVHKNRAAAPTAPAASSPVITTQNNERSTTSNVNSSITSNNNARANTNTNKSSIGRMETDKTVDAPPANTNNAQKGGTANEAEKSVTSNKGAEKKNNAVPIKQRQAEIEEKAREAEEKYETKTAKQLAKDADYHNHLHLRDLVPFLTHGSKSEREVKKAEDKARTSVIDEERASVKTIEEEKKLLKKKLADEEKEARKRHKAAEKEESKKKKDSKGAAAVGEAFIDKIKGGSHSSKDAEGRANKISLNDKKEKEINAASRTISVSDNKTTEAQPLKIKTETRVNRAPAFVTTSAAAGANNNTNPNPRRRREGKRKYRRTYGSIVSGFVGSPTQTPLGQPSRSISAEDLRKREEEKAMRRGKAALAKEAERPIVAQPVSVAYEVASRGGDFLTVADAELSTKRMNNNNDTKKNKFTTNNKVHPLVFAEAQKKGKAKSRDLSGRAANSSAAAAVSSNVVPGVSFRDKLLEKKSNNDDVVAPAVIVVVPPSSAPATTGEGEWAAHKNNGGVHRRQRFRPRKHSQKGGAHQVEDLLSPTTYSYVASMQEAEEESLAEHAEQLLRDRETTFSSHRRHRSNKHKIH